MTVHPRSRGEHDGGGKVCQNPIGSSPLARGTPAARRSRRIGTRFIPARAGNTDHPPPIRGGKTVHPRSRGEHSLDITELYHANGSSPLARGTPVLPDAEQPPNRFIPARAGNTKDDTITCRRATVHPRSRGEHPESSQGSCRRPGSSPLARGTQLSRLRHPPPLRFIPARAGNTVMLSTCKLLTPVHPRSRGEHVIRSRAASHAAGSSPLARGTRNTGCLGGLSRRFIPARAGNTVTI